VPGQPVVEAVLDVDVQPAFDVEHPGGVGPGHAGAGRGDVAHPVVDADEQHHDGDLGEQQGTGTAA
jgi:hypothetical protein